jgi:SAM-dependent methyltransferase
MNPKDIVRAGYDNVSYTYRGDTLDQNDPDMIQYAQWITELTTLVPPPAAVLDLGCGNGLPVAKLLCDAGFAVTGVDISPVQIARVQAALPDARFICADMTEFIFEPDTFAAIVCFYAIIHIPVAEQPPLLANIFSWLQPGGFFLATVGLNAWTGTEADWLDVPGGLMYWSHADAATYRQWCEDQGFRICWTRFVPEGDGGHTLLLAQKPSA